MRKLFSPVWLIVVVWAILFITNLKPGTYLTGWDNLHPEFDFGISIKRSIFAVWQEYQGLGLLGGMGHAADLIRQLFLVLLSVFIPQNYLRYVWTMLCLLIGGLGAYKLSLAVLTEHKPTHKHKLATLVAGLFYVFNLSTLQVFYIPFETFTSHFAFLPWILWSAIVYLRKPTPRNFLIFSLVSLVATSSYYVPTLFVVTLFALGITSAVLFVFEKNLSFLWKVTKMFLAVFITNAFWLLPFLYFSLTNAHVVAEAKINQMATSTIFLENKEFGNIQNVAFLRGFWFNKLDPDSHGNLNFLMGQWRDYSKSVPFITAGILLFLLILLGLIQSVKERKKLRVVFASLFIFSFTMLMGSTPPFSWAENLFRHSLPYFAEAFRFPFTKFSVLTSLTYSLLLAVGVTYLANTIRQSVFRYIIYGLFTLIILFYMFPVYRGNLFYAKEQVKIPQEYFQTFDFFKKQKPNTRIANFPQYTFWGWNYYRWGYGGSGFLWYGINQPILDRAFDVWNNYNENYYWEVTYAVYSKNPQLLSNVFEKYQINWVLIDKNIFNTASQKVLYNEELKNILLQSNKAVLEKKFGNIEIYKVHLDTPVNDFVYSIKNPPVVNPVYRWTNQDSSFSTVGDYVSDTTEPFENILYYPFRSLFNGRNGQDKRSFEINETGDSFVISAPVPYSVNAIQNTQDDIELPFANPPDLRKVTYSQPMSTLSNARLNVEFPKVGGYFSAVISPDSSDVDITCDKQEKKTSEYRVQEDNKQKILELKNKGTSCRFSVWLPQLQHNLSYIISVESKNKKGEPLIFWIENPISRKADMETNLPKSSKVERSHFIQPPMEEDGVGYTIHIDNRSAGNNLTINELGTISVYTFPYKYLSNLHFGGVLGNSITEPLEAQHPNQALYFVRVPDNATRTIVLSQSWSPGWFAYINPAKPFQHVLVNNWENGWKVENEGGKTITLVYLPQLLEFTGFVILLIGGLYFVLLFKPWNLRLCYLGKSKKPRA